MHSLRFAITNLPLDMRMSLTEMTVGVFFRRYRHSRLVAFFQRVFYCQLEAFFVENGKTVECENFEEILNKHKWRTGARSRTSISIHQATVKLQYAFSIEFIDLKTKKLRVSTRLHPSFLGLMRGTTAEVLKSIIDDC